MFPEGSRKEEIIFRTRAFFTMVPSGVMQAASVKNFCLERGCEVKEPAPGFIVAYNFDSKVLGGETKELISNLDGRLPVVGPDNFIDPGQLQWVTGENVNLHYRGNALPRRKVWIQDGPTDDKILVYSYTGWNNPISFATSDWNRDAYLKGVCDKYNAFSDACGFERANHAIVTAYDDKDANIGMHYDKIPSLSLTSGIAVVKMGEPRRFCLRERILPNDRMNFLKAKKKKTAEEKEELEQWKKAVQEEQEKEPMIFDEVVPAGTLLFMTMETNFGTQHGVPEADNEVGLSGSIVFRTVKDRRSVQRIQKEASKVYAGRASKGIRKKSKGMLMPAIE